MPFNIGQSAATAAEPKRKRTRLTTWLLRVLFSFALLFVIAAVFIAVNWPFKQQRLTDVLQQRFGRSVVIGSWHTTLFPPGGVAEDISFLHRKHKNKPPLVTIKKLVVEGSYWGLISPHKHISGVRLYGLHVTVPPSDPSGKPNPVMPLTQDPSRRQLGIGSVIADGTVLDFVQRTPDKPPVRLTIQKLTLDNVGNNLPLNFDALISNANPPSLIESAGRFGTWNPDDPASSPVEGWYRLNNGNLSAYKVLSGTLQSTGKFKGTLGAISVQGSASARDFHVKGSSHTRDVLGSFDATVAATDGNVDLNTLTARFDNSTVMIKGSFRGQPDESGKTVSLNVQSTAARIDDLLDLVLKSRQPPMTGDVAINAQIGWPPNATSFIRDMQANGKFRISSGQFTNPEIEQDLTRISNSAAKKDDLPQQSPATLPCVLAGALSVRNGAAEFSRLLLSVPGAGASLNGSYSLLDYTIDLHGHLHTDGSPAAATTGFKSIVLRGLMPFFQRKNGQKVIPLKIQGQYRDAKVDLDLGHKSKPQGQ